MKIFLVAPQIEEDLATRITVTWAEGLRKSLQKTAEYSLMTFLGKDAVCKKVESALKDDEGAPGVFIFIDHGQKDRLIDSENNSLIDMDNIRLLKNKFIYTIACESATDLGHRALQEDAVGYIGFINKFQVIPFAQMVFGHCFIKGILAIITEKRKTKDIKDIVSSEILQKIMEIESYKKIPKQDKIIIITSLKHNLNSMICLGDPNWCMA